MSLRSVSEILPSTRVILRMDLDVAEGDNSRLIKSLTDRVSSLEIIVGKTMQNCDYWAQRST